MTEDNKSIAEITTDVYALLKDLNADDRQKVINATLALFGEENAKPAFGNQFGGGNADFESLGPKASRWIAQNSISRDQLEQIFHIDGADVEIIISELPGKSKKAQTGAAHLLCGVKALLQNDDPKFENSQVVDLCKTMGCYDEKNQPTNRKALGNKISGTVKNGFVLPAPGLKAAAELIKSK